QSSSSPIKNPAVTANAIRSPRPRFSLARAAWCCAAGGVRASIRGAASAVPRRSVKIGEPGDGTDPKPCETIHHPVVSRVDDDVRLCAVSNAARIAFGFEADPNRETLCFSEPSAWGPNRRQAGPGRQLAHVDAPADALHHAGKDFAR